MTSIKFIVCVSVTVVLGCMVGCRKDCVPPAECTLPVTLQPQQQGLWCWAATGQMIMEFHSATASQCDQANVLFNLTACCNAPGPITTGTVLAANCNQGGSPPFDHYNFTFDKANGLTWDQLRNQIYCKQWPFAWIWEITGGGQHMVVVVGYSTVGKEKTVFFADPATNPDSATGTTGADYGHMPYENYRHGFPGQMTHVEDLYNIRSKP